MLSASSPAGRLSLRAMYRSSFHFGSRALVHPRVLDLAGRNRGLYRSTSYDNFMAHLHLCGYIRMPQST
ncbi:predicted protein [Sclerotinia sclerotiorum 1980 UF-70]|uniref:Uncharacterized protein n=1 Tax=Sclerotinia sclerotiorum (strain ATCC 18683 / 1980 / Ss-1) TaxID=665079 RepID=A7EVM6_SCLS1|nr:predicted protein [Sclerotinia sclerotiorum 1980 UF-70]EDN93518.1 predicted protein [Sclerotinia sclerotiorum 1980 UF-70]